MAWAIVAGAAVATVGGALLADDNGAEADAFYEAVAKKIIDAIKE